MHLPSQPSVRANSTADPTPIDQSDNTNYDATSDTHNIIIGSIALVLAAATIVLAVVLFRLERRRGQLSTQGGGSTEEQGVGMDDLERGSSSEASGVDSTVQTAVGESTTSEQQLSGTQ
ncbi:uncharacterized protein LTR77_009733 [Saxophila tyrrhenica]|uniref:Uncharacterized protein n=1 Tax=Saxophila tyrrhenica TaxID=1690608 RepID=A0AAV9P0I5_9PEZI|nr:hypothetical protein LTR77_009733 [Saxophila tyrrhenica]